MAAVLEGLLFSLVIGLQTIVRENLIVKMTDWCVSARCAKQCCLRAMIEREVQLQKSPRGSPIESLTAEIDPVA